MSIVTIGADPELAVSVNGVISHCIGILGGSKSKPRPVEKGAVQEDNVAFEFNIDPASSFEEFSNHIDCVLEHGIQLLPEGYDLHAIASHSFTKEELSTMPPEAFIFGCDPDFNALTGFVNPKPSAKDEGLRSFGGHVHIGAKEIAGDEQASRFVIVACDYLLGLPSLLEDSDTRRRELYGKAGAYRQKPFGVEYRTLSNYWVIDKDLRKNVYERAVRAAEYHSEDKMMELMSIADPYTVQEILNRGDKQAAEAILKELF